MTPEREFIRRLAAGLFVVGLLLVISYAIYAFLSVAVLAVFLYYAVRPIFRFLHRFGLSRRIRAVLSLMLFGLPFLVLIGYAVAIIALEVQSFLEEHGLLADTTDRISEELNIAGLDLGQLETLTNSSGSTPGVETVLDSVLGAASAVGSAFIQLLLVLVAVYYMLVDGPRFVEWLLSTYDESGVVREYVREVDPELLETMFGNIVTIFVTALMAIVTFYAFNLLVPATIEIPFPALAGVLAGVASLIPVVGIKIVYVPLTVGLGANAWLANEPELLAPVVVLAVVSAAIIDFIPDIFVRAKVSSDDTHEGLLIVSYIVGPTLFGFYGLFLAPIILIATTNAATVLLPYALLGTPSEQTTLSRFAGDDASVDGKLDEGDDDIPVETD
jgi:predicted PurR-regulated permease PerM